MPATSSHAGSEDMIFELDFLATFLDALEEAGSSDASAVLANYRRIQDIRPLLKSCGPSEVWVGFDVSELQKIIREHRSYLRKAAYEALARIAEQENIIHERRRHLN